MIKKPTWVKNAIATTKGWKHIKTGELLFAKRYTQAEVDLYNGVGEFDPETIKRVEPFVDEEVSLIDTEVVSEEIPVEEVGVVPVTIESVAEEVSVVDEKVEVVEEDSETTIAKKSKKIIKVRT